MSKGDFDISRFADVMRLEFAAPLKPLPYDEDFRRTLELEAPGIVTPSLLEPVDDEEPLPE